MDALRADSTLQSGKYRIIKKLGQGGFGITYLAENTLLEGKVAIKEFFFKEYCERNELTCHVTVPTSNNRDTVQRFKQKFIKEAKTIFRLNHPNIVRILDVFEENDTAYYVMEYIEGESLSDMVTRRGAIPFAEAIGYVKAAAEALMYIHSKKINHLDIKPGNLMKRNEDGEIVLIDFGVAKQYDLDTSQGTTTTPVGISCGYSPTEQYRKNGVQTFSPQSDVYSLAATLFKLLTGNTPPEAMEIQDEGLPVAELQAKHIPSTVISAIAMAMKGRHERTQSVELFIANLQKTEDTFKVAENQQKTENIRKKEEARLPSGEDEIEALKEAEAQAMAEARAKVAAARKAREEAERKAREEAERKAEKERKAREEAERKIREARKKAEAERKAREEAEIARKAREEAERKAREEAEQKAREEAARIAHEVAIRKAREEAEAKVLAQAKAMIEAERKAREAAEAKAVEATRKAEAEREAREQAERIAREKAEAERVAREEAARIAREKAETERKVKAEAERRALEDAKRKVQEARMEAARIAREEAERKAREEAEAKVAEAARKAEAERKAREQAERIAHEKAEAERKAREEAERIVREKAEAERKAKAEAEKRALEEAERKAREEAERKAREEADRKAREKSEAERKAREEAERKAKEEAERKAHEEAVRKAHEEAELKIAEAKAKVEAERKARKAAEAKAAKVERWAREEAERRIKLEAEDEMQTETETVHLEESDVLQNEETSFQEDNIESTLPEYENELGTTQKKKSKKKWLWISIGLFVIIGAMIKVNQMGIKSQSEFAEIQKQKNDTVWNKTIVIAKGHESKRNFVYSGAVDVDELPHGKGEANYPETKSSGSCVFIGTFVHGITSEGEMKFSNGAKYNGTFTEDGYYKKGTWTEQNGYYFEGTFKNGDPYKGTWYTPKGKKYAKVVKGKSV